MTVFETERLRVRTANMRDARLIHELWTSPEVMRNVGYPHGLAVEATPNVGNVASIRMQEAVGGVRGGEAVFEFPESLRGTTPVHHYVYRVTREAWKQSRDSP